ncbi:hypothetical protein QVD17_26467 [Tagetes erecta]|uniref:Protein SPEAR3-like n=1 Tax=Tagetes erecta TaxID=13708 RepID=A0AAD8KCZ3_TARER|nr:hypothetical protein QVD17_26467 [Tagetes erecta]
MNYFGESAGGSSSSSSSSRKSKKSGSDKPKQPQRGLGVAQLEKIRIHSQMGQLLPQEDIRIQTAYSSSSSYNSPISTASFATLQGHHSHMMGTSELERTNFIYGDQSLQYASTNHRWDASYAQAAGISRHQLFSPELVEDSIRKKKRKDENESSSQNSDSNGSQELDLELRLSL